MKNFLLGFSISCFFLQCQSQDNKSKEFTDHFATDSCRFSTAGRNSFFILEPGYQLILEGKEEGKPAKLMITVLNETRTINHIETRIVEEREWLNGEIVEISWNFFAVCENTGNIFYFGEEVDMYKDGKIVDHEGAWIAEGKNKPGMIMPGKPIKGDRYYQELAPGIAMDRAEIIDLSASLQTPAGRFTGCLKTLESSALKSSEKEFKFYAPGIGLVKEENLLLTSYGFIK